MSTKLLGPEPFFHEVGHWHPFDLNPALYKNLKQIIEQAIVALSIQSAVIHAEFRLHNEEPYLIEMAARVAGDLIPFVVVQATGVNLLEVGVKLCTGEPVFLNKRQPTPSFIYFAHDVAELARAKGLPGVTVTRYEEPSEGRLGHCLGSAASQSEVRGVIQFIQGQS